MLQLSSDEDCRCPRNSGSPKNCQSRYHILLTIFNTGEAVCSGLPAGNVSIALNIGSCPHGNPFGYTATGWPSATGNALTKIIVEETKMSSVFSVGKFSLPILAAMTYCLNTNVLRCEPRVFKSLWLVYSCSKILKFFP